MEFVGGEPSKKRKRRTSFTPQAIEALNAYFEKNTLPTGHEITEIAKELNYDREVVRVWFCNRRQTLKNTSKLNVFQIPWGLELKVRISLSLPGCREHFVAKSPLPLPPVYSDDWNEKGEISSCFIVPQPAASSFLPDVAPSCEGLGVHWRLTSFCVRQIMVS